MLTPLFAALEKKTTTRHGRDELIKKGLLEIMEQGKWQPSSFFLLPGPFHKNLEGNSLL